MDLGQDPLPDPTKPCPPTSTFFTIDKAKRAIDRMMTGRAFDHDGPVVEHFIHARATIVPIFKAGDPTVPGNYRTIMVGHTLARLYASILEQQLSSWAEDEGIRAKGQAEHKEDLSLLQPSDYKHTFLHSRLFINADDGNCSAKDNEMDAWKAAELQRQLVNSYRIMQMQIRDVMDKRKILRGHLAGSQLTIEKKLQLLEHENIAFEKTEKEIRRNTLDQQNYDKMSKAQPQCIDKPVLESSKPVNTNSSDLSDKTSRIMDHSLDKGEEEEVPQGLTFIDCGSKQMLHISAVGVDCQNNAEEHEIRQVIDHSGTSILCCDEDIKICLDSSTAVVKIDGQKNSRKLVRKAPSCKSNKQANREQFYDCDKGLVLESLKVDCDSSETKTNENKSLAHSPAGDKKKFIRRAAGIKSILPLHKDRKKKPELQALPAQKQVKAVKFS
ncbi:hypothetical protein L7F22_017032 [Adiantum nelumboides]|nr:hypothetical protein [Adiantum nelumboides]